MKITKQKLKRLVNKGLSVKEISAIFKCSRQAIYNSMQVNGIKLNRSFKPVKLLCPSCTEKIKNI